MEKSTVVQLRDRIRWTPELHSYFVDVVAQLGGPEKATPKSILKLMDVEALSLCHVKSHLQKYRLALSYADYGNKACNNSTGMDYGGYFQMENTEAMKLQMEMLEEALKQLQEQLMQQTQGNKEEAELVDLREQLSACCIDSSTDQADMME